MNNKLPCIIFTSDCVLCDEEDALASIREIFDMSQLKHAFFTSLGGNLRAFRHFCENERLVDVYRIYKLKPLGKYRYSFCEKNIIGGSVVTTVFLAEDQSSFYSFLSPESRYFKNLHDRLSYELFYIKNNNIHDMTSVSPSAFLVLSRVPHLVESLFGEKENTEHCNIIDFTKSATDELSCSTPLNGNEIRFISKCFDPSIPATIQLPSIPFAFLLFLATSVASTLSYDHKIDVTVSTLGSSAEIEICTVSHRFDENIPPCDTCVLEDIIPSAANFAKIISIISDAAGIESNISFALDNQKLSFVFGINYEPTPIPDFKFNDPAEHITTAFEEALNILSE